jgi:hypothetical protein
LAVVVIGDGEGRSAGAGNEEHAEGRMASALSAGAREIPPFACRTASLGMTPSLLLHAF